MSAPAAALIPFDAVAAPRDENGLAAALVLKMPMRRGSSAETVAVNAVAEDHAVRPHLPAAVAGIARRRVADDLAAGNAVEVVERLRETDRPPGELDEGAVAVEGAGGIDCRAGEVEPDVDQGAQHPVLGLLARIHGDVGAADEGPVLAVIPVVGRVRAGVADHRGHAVEVAALERPVGRERPFQVGHLRAHVSADLHADVGSGQVVEAVAIQIADLHGWENLPPGQRTGIQFRVVEASTARPPGSPIRCSSRLATAFVKASGIRWA